MSDHGHELRFGSFLTPANADPGAVVGLAQLSEQLGLDLVTFQDHPYQPAFLDTWTLMTWVAASTVDITVAPNVLNLPLRPPAVVARSAAALDLLSGGRFELGLGAGAFGTAVEAMGGPHRSGGEAVDALAEAVEVIRQLWDTGTRGGARLDGRHYRLQGAKRGPAPAHPVGIWLGAYKPRMLRLTGRVADGWLPSSGYLPPEQLGDANRVIDEAAVAAGRQPADVRRLYNVSGAFGRGGGFLQGRPADWAEQLSQLAVEQGLSTFILGSDDPETLSRYADEVAPAVREQVAALRARAIQPPEPAPQPPVTAPVQVRQSAAATLRGAAFTVVPTPDPGTRLRPDPSWDESERPVGPAPDPDRRYTPHELASGQHLVDVHDHLRSELTQVRGLVEQVLDGTTDPGAARSRINEMTMRQNSWTVGAYCAAYCRVVTTHHTLEDQSMFPRLRAADPRLAPVVDRLEHEHEVIHDVLERVDAALVGFVTSDDGAGLQRAVDELTDTLLSHLSYEERELVEPIARYGVLG